MILARKLCVGYGTTPVLEKLDFEVPRGDVFLILGGSGCGKSTLLRTLIGLQPKLGGSIDLSYGPTPEADGEVRKPGAPGFGVLFQSSALFGSMTLEDNVAMPLRRWTTLSEQTILELVRWKLILVGLDGFEHHLPSELSGGMRKRAGIARALALEPQLLFLDEPSAGLDPVSAAELDELLLTLNRSLNVTLVVVTHELASIFKIGRHCIVLDRDSHGILASGDPRELRDHSADERVRTFFNRSTRELSAS